MKIPSRRKIVAAFLLVAVAAASSASHAQEAEGERDTTGLPGGASSLTETHGAWTVSCRLQRQVEQAVRLCALSQLQANNQGQRALAIELRPSEDGASGVMILPFGLVLAQSVILRIDEGNSGEPLPFSTCLPAGCVVRVSFDTTQIEALRQGTNLTVTASSVGGSEVNLAISLDGFTSALQRTRELLE